MEPNEVEDFLSALLFLFLSFFPFLPYSSLHFALDWI